MRTVYPTLGAALLLLFSVFVWRPVARYLRRAIPSDRIRLHFGRFGDLVYPKWRVRLDVTRQQITTDFRIRELRRLRRPPRFVIVGGIYLDISLRPVGTRTLVEQEYNDLDAVDVRVGGSASFVGKYLFEDHRVSSQLFSMMGRPNDPITVALQEKIRQTRWIRNRKQLPTSADQCAVSVHLVQRAGSFTTTFTHKGALSSLGWAAIYDPVQKAAKRASVIYVSGYFRTNLHANLRRLETLAPKSVIALDHGRFQAVVASEAALSLADAFRTRLIDAYLCTRDELQQFATAVHSGATDPSASEEELLTGLHGFLPAITVVRTALGDVHTAVNGLITKHEAVRAFTVCSERGHINAFNSGFLYALVKGDPQMALDAVISSAVQAGLNSWGDRCQA